MAGDFRRFACVFHTGRVGQKPALGPLRADASRKAIAPRMAARQSWQRRSCGSGGDTAMNLYRRHSRSAGTIFGVLTNALRVARQRQQAGIMLAECMIYLAVSSVLLGLAFAAFYRVMDNA